MDNGGLKPATEETFDTLEFLAADSGRTWLHPDSGTADYEFQTVEMTGFGHLAMVGEEWNSTVDMKVTGEVTGDGSGTYHVSAFQTSTITLPPALLPPAVHARSQAAH